MNPFALPFMQIALAASILSGTALALLGVFILVKRVAFSGLAVSQLAALGTVIGISLLAFHAGAEGLAMVFVGAGMWLLSRLSNAKTVPQESWVACLYVLGAALSVLILSKAPRGETETLGIFFGNVLTLNLSEVYESLAFFIATGVILWVWFHRWVWISFDPVSAEIDGIKIDRWNFLFYALFAAGMTLAIHILGVLLAFAYLLLPATAGLLATRRMRNLFFFVPVMTILITVIGFYISFKQDFPTGPFVAALMALCVLIVKLVNKFIFKTSRGK